MDLFDALPTPAEMAEWDAASHAFGIRPELLMDAAAREALHVLRQEAGPLAGKRVLLVAGPGNNGGDALALARHLDAEGAEATVLHTRSRGAYTGASGYHARLAARAGVEMLPWQGGRTQMPEHAHILVDGLLGTGLTGEVRSEFQELIDRMNLFRFRNAGGFVLALDIPSGLSGVTGRPCPVAVQAHATVTFQAAKLGMAQPEAKPFLGRLHVRSIGIPRQVREHNPPRHVLMTPRLVGLLPDPTPELHKGTAGHVLVAGGSPGLTGAPMLAAMGALRAGAGLSTVACPAGLTAEVKAGNPDVMLLPLGDGREWTPDMAQALAAELPRFGALAIGPGLGRTPGAADFLAALLEHARPPAVLDADALFHLAQQPVLLAKLTAADVLTPHPGEAARLLTTDIAALQADRPRAAEALAALCPAVTVLKGAASLAAQAGRPAAVSPFHEPNLAVAGSGDVLAGVIASLLARGLPAQQAACLGVYWHGQAGAELEREFPYRGNTASDIASALPRALAALKGR